MGVRKKNMADQLKADRKQRAFAKLTNCPTSPRKMRLVADQVRGVEVEKALQKHVAFYPLLTDLPYFFYELPYPTIFFLYFLHQRVL
jgi:hypothetical protein